MVLIRTLCAVSGRKLLHFGMRSVCRQSKKLLDSAKTGGVTVRIRGKEPAGGGAELMYTAMQVCLTNAIQYAKATEISANIWGKRRQLYSDDTQ